MSTQKPGASFSGGGVRGIITANWLKEVEGRAQLDHLRDAVSALAGTSTGSIIAALVAFGYQGVLIADLYRDLAPSIFPKRRFLPLSRRMLSRSYYSQAPLESLLREYLRDARLSESPIRLLIHAYNVSRKTPVTFDSHDPHCAGIRVSDAILASSAAPTYFAPHLIDDEAFMDGGLTANNPSALLNRIAGCDRIVSFGTGRRTRFHTAQQASEWNGFNQAAQVIDAAMDNAEIVEQDMTARLGDGFVHLDTDLMSASDDMDDASEENLNLLKLEAESAMFTRHAEFERAAYLLRREG